MATNKPRIPVTMEPELFEQVTEYRNRHGIASQSKAIRRLVQIGISSLESAPEPRAHGETGTGARDSQERELLEIARKLNPEQKALLLRLLEIAGEREEAGQSQ